MNIGILDAITKKAEPKQEHEHQHQHQQFSCVHPLTPDSRFPCIVRLIQDDTPMGRFNKYSFGNPIEHPELWETEIAEEVIDDTTSTHHHEVRNSDGAISVHYSRFEIIGYPDDIMENPEPKPKFEVGSYIRSLSGSCHVVISDNKCRGLKVIEEYDILDSDVPIPASEVVLDFGSGIKGIIVSQNYDGGSGICVINDRNAIANIMICAISEPMKSIVISLLERQEKEGEE